MKRTYLHVLKRLVATPERFVAAYCLPNGHGHCINDSYASGVTMRQLRHDGYVEFGKNDDSNMPGYRITAAGRLAIDAALKPEVQR